MDSLSVPVAIVGLLGTAETVRRKVTAFKEKRSSAGKLADAVLLEITSIEASLPRLRRLVNDDEVSTRDNIFLDQLSTVLTGCVKRFSELESSLGGLPTITEAEANSIDQPIWARNEKLIRATTELIQPYRVSLFLMLQVLELQSLKDQRQALLRIQSDIEQLKNCMLSSDPDLAMRMDNAEVLPSSDAASNASTSPETTRIDRSGPTTAVQPTSPKSPMREFHTAEPERRRPNWRSSFRVRTHRSDETAQRFDRPASVTTSSSTTSGSTISTTSTSSRLSLAAVGDVSVYKLPITAEDVSNGHRYIGVALEPASKAIAEDDDEILGIEEMIASAPPTQHRKVLPVLTRHEAESRAESALISRAPEGSKRMTAPVAEIEMTARKYQGYWRASFTADMPAAAAMCGCLLQVAGSSSGPATRLTESAETAERAATLCETLEQSQSPAKVIMTLYSYDFGTLLFALKRSLVNSQIPVVPAKTAFAMYQKIADAKGDPKKQSKVWQHVAKVLKKVPQETIVPLMFLTGIGRKLRARGLMVGNRSAAFYLMEDLWPQVGSRSLFALDTEAGDAASKLLLDNYDDIPDELPLILQAANYRFDSGSRCNLLALLTTKRVRPDMGGRKMSDASAS